MITFKRYLLTLVALLAMTTGAWAGVAPNAVTALEIDATVYSGWSSMDGVLLKASELPGFHKITLEQAKTWADVPATGTVYLIYEIVADGDIKVVKFKDGNYSDSYEWTEQERYEIWENINYSDKKYFYTTGPAGTPEPAIEVTTNAAEEGATFTEASFQMPAFDATADYELVRDLSESVNFLGIPTGNGATVKKDGDKYTFATAPIITLSDVLNPSDAISIFYYNDGFSYVESGLTLNVYPMVEVEGKWKADETATPVALADFLASPQPGRWMIKATATTGLYDGTLYSPEFTLAEAYDLTLSPATDANLQSVTVAGTAKTADANGVIRGIEPTKKVKITTTGPDYIIRKAAVKKTPKANE